MLFRKQDISTEWFRIYTDADVGTIEGFFDSNPEDPSGLVLKLRTTIDGAEHMGAYLIPDENRSHKQIMKINISFAFTHWAKYLLEGDTNPKGTKMGKAISHTAKHLYGVTN